MKLLIKNSTLVDASSELNNKVVDLLIIDGIIEDVVLSEKNLTSIADCEVYDASNCFVSPGWLDLHANFREPGEETKESIRTGQDAAMAGGFTGVVLMPSTARPIQSKSDIEFVQSKSKGHIVEVFQTGALTIDREGKDLTEMFDMQSGGAVAFTDDKRFIENSGVMTRALQYAGQINTRIIHFAEDKFLAGSSLANESLNTMLLGFKGSPSISEKIALQRDINLVEYTGQPLHISGISTKDAVDAIRDAKSRNLPITADVYAYHLLLDDSSLETFDSNFKVKPPLRSLIDIEALKEGLLDGTIDAIASDHSPQDIESKDVEYDFASFGMISLETAFAVVNTAFAGKVSATQIATWLNTNPYKILNLQLPVIKKGTKANLTVFSLDETWIFSSENIKSKSKNTPFLGTEFKGKVKAVYNNRIFNSNS